MAVMSQIVLYLIDDRSSCEKYPGDDKKVYWNLYIALLKKKHLANFLSPE